MALMDDLAARLTSPEHAAELVAWRLTVPAPGVWHLGAVRPMHSRRRISKRLLAQGGPWLDVVWSAQWHGPRGETRTQWWHGAMNAQPGGIPGTLRIQPLESQAPWADFLAGGGRIVRIEPGEHCTAHFPALNNRPDHFAKCYADDRLAPARATLGALWQASQTRAAAFLIGAPLDDDATCLRQHTVTGTALATHWRATGAGAEALVNALLDLSRHGPRLGAALSREAILADAHKWHKKLLLADPALRPALDAALATLDAVPDRTLPNVPTHGDCHIDQMLWRDGRVAVFDYDNLCQAEAGRDLADFISQLLCRHDGHDWQPLIDALMHHWRAGAGDLHDPELFDWHLRSLLLRKAYSQFVRSHAGWPARCRHALQLAASPRLPLTTHDTVIA